MDTSLVALGALAAASLVSAALWYAAVKSAPLAVVASALTVALVTYFAYPVYRGVAASPLILADSAILGAAIALGVGLALKRWHLRKKELP
ncbi:MAG TPA: hypothetical protein VFI80_10520 [Burkholderiales bacterium]|nr:hypothetical protein [Burkholderiales bacterium]